MAENKEFDNVDGGNFKLISPYFRFNKNMDFSGINTVVLHWTAGNNVNNDIKALKQNGYGYHFLIDSDGKTYQGAPVEKRISHAGYSYGPKGTGLNNYSIGVSFSMRGDESKVKGSTVFNDKQKEACIKLLLDLKEAVPTLEYVTGHHWVSPGRKIDPYTLDFDKLLKKSVDGKTLITDGGYKIWKTNQKPFPSGLTDCKCIKEDKNGNCVKSTGQCKGQGGYGYSERNLSFKISELTITSDLASD